MLNIVSNPIILGVVMLNVVILSVVAPFPILSRRQKNVFVCLTTRQIDETSQHLLQRCA
jgi:hypothetical protein